MRNAKRTAPEICMIDPPSISTIAGVRLRTRTPPTPPVRHRPRPDITGVRDRKRPPAVTDLIERLCRDLGEVVERQERIVERQERIVERHADTTADLLDLSKKLWRFLDGRPIQPRPILK